MGSKALEAQRLRAELVGLRVAPWHVSFGSAIERGMEVHVHRVLLRSYWLLCGLDVHHQLHSLSPWNEFLAQDPGRTWPVLHNIMALVLGGKHRWNEMLFHDVHHAFPNAVGTLSQRGRFHGWEKVHDAAAEVLHRGLWEAKWRRRDADAEDPEEALFDDEAEQVKQIELQMEHDGIVPNCSKLFRPGCCEQ